jgi:hypothetical protein
MWPAIIERRSGFVVDTSNGSHLTGVAEARPNGPDFLARAGVDAPGWLLYGGPLPAIRRGYYTAIFSLAANTTAPGQLGMLEVYTDNLGVVARKVLQRDDFPADGSFRDFSLPFTAQTDMEGLRLAVGVTGTADIRAMGAVLQRDARGNLPLTAEDRFPGWPLTVAWLAGIALLATVLAFPGAAPPQGPRQRVPPA